jgi:hypothetical protein
MNNSLPNTGHRAVVLVRPAVRQLVVERAHNHPGFGVANLDQINATITPHNYLPGAFMRPSGRVRERLSRPAATWLTWCENS